MWEYQQLPFSFTGLYSVIQLIIQLSATLLFGFSLAALIAAVVIVMYSHHSGALAATEPHVSPTVQKRPKTKLNDCE